jgi:hypothetical protein
MLAIEVEVLVNDVNPPRSTFIPASGSMVNKSAVAKVKA